MKRQGKIKAWNRENSSCMLCMEGSFQSTSNPLHGTAGQVLLGLKRQQAGTAGASPATDHLYGAAHHGMH
jgi:hypothetical protein